MTDRGTRRAKQICTFDQYRWPMRQCREVSFGEWFRSEVLGPVAAWVLLVLMAALFLLMLNGPILTGPR